MQFHADEWSFLDEYVTPNMSGVLDPMPSIVGPIDVRYAIQIRNLIGSHVDIIDTSPIDIFVLSIGEPPRRDVSKIGGLPYLRRGEPWPLSRYGDPLPFLAQFDFRESRDLTGDIPGTHLLIFGNLDGEDGFRIVWQNDMVAGEMLSVDEIFKAPYAIPQFWGTRWRTFNYAEYKVDSRFEMNDCELPDGVKLGMYEFALRMGGMTIGRHPFVLNGQEITRNGERILCSLTMVAPHPDSPFPFINHPNEIREQESPGNTLNLASLPDADFFGLLYIIQDRQGELRAEFTTL